MNSDQYRAALGRFNGHLDRFNEKLEKSTQIMLPPLLGAVLGIFLSEIYKPAWPLFLVLGAVLGFFVDVAVKYLIRRLPLVIDIIGTALAISIMPFLIKLLYRCLININITDVKPEAKFMVISFLGFGLIGCLMLIYKLPDLLKRLFSDKDQQAHLIFVVSMALLGWGLWLQNGGNWQQMAVLNSPITIPGFFTIPFTESISFPTALLGWVENPVQSAISTVAHAPFDLTIALFVGAVVLFFFAINRLKLSAVGVRPELAWLAFALFCAAGYIDVALHWRGAPVLHPALIVFNRAFAVLALGVYLFWRFTARQAPEVVEGESGEYQAAFDMADSSARKAALWLLGLLWLATQFSHGFPNGFPEWIVTVMLALLVWFPVQSLINFSGEHQAALGRYNKLLALQRQAYKPPSTVASDEQVRDALNGGRGIGQRGPDGKPWNDPGD